MILGLRIDVCTYEGLRTGVPALLSLLARFEQRASFFLALGPDRSGRALFQLFRPGFAAKMRRTRAIRAYGWRTVLSGTLLPARQAGDLEEVVRAIPAAGHEVAVHGYDHRRWQDRLFRMAESEVRREMAQAVAVYERVIGRRPRGLRRPRLAVQSGQPPCVGRHGIRLRQRHAGEAAVLSVSERTETPDAADSDNTPHAGRGSWPG